jgi:hypothetical protein
LPYFNFPGRVQFPRKLNTFDVDGRKSRRNSEVYDFFHF